MKKRGGTEVDQIQPFSDFSTLALVEEGAVRCLSAVVSSHQAYVAHCWFVCSCEEHAGCVCPEAPAP